MLKSNIAEMTTDDFIKEQQGRPNIVQQIAVNTKQKIHACLTPEGKDHF